MKIAFTTNRGSGALPCGENLATMRLGAEAVVCGGRSVDRGGGSYSGPESASAKS